MRRYDSAAVAFALRVSPDRLDNLLSHHRVAGVVSGRRGLARRVGLDSVTVLAVALDLIENCAIPTREALRLAERLAQSPNGEVAISESVTLRIDLPRAAQSVAARLDDAVEVVVPQRRGRPPGSVSRKTGGPSDPEKQSGAPPSREAPHSADAKLSELRP